MARARMIKPAFFKHAELYAAERDSGMPLRLAFAGLWTVADREGRFKWKPDLKPDILPYDDVDMLAVLDALEHTGFVRSYVVGGKRYGVIPSFSEHQTFHKTERRSTLPAPLANGESTVSYTAQSDPDTDTDSEKIVDDLGADAVRVPPEPQLTDLYLAICANKAVAEKWGEQPHPFTQASAASLSAVLRSAGVPPEVARLSFYRQCRENTQPRPPRSINYFRPGIEQDWEAEKTRRAVAADGTGPPRAAETRAPPSRRAPPRRATPQSYEYGTPTPAPRADEWPK